MCDDYYVQNKNEYDRAYYQANKERRKAQIRERNVVAIERNRKNLIEYLSDKSCVDCGYTDSRALQFDHIDPQCKRNDVSNMVGSAYSWESILEEIAKCEIVCANCHSVRTCETYGWHKSNTPL